MSTLIWLAVLILLANEKSEITFKISFVIFGLLTSNYKYIYIFKKIIIIYNNVVLR